MVQCSMCPNELRDIINLSQCQAQKTKYQKKQQEADNREKPYMLLKRKNSYYVICSQKCFYANIIQMQDINSHILEKFDLIFQNSQIKEGIIEQLSNLNYLLKQEISLTENVYKKKSSLDIAFEFRKQISESVKNIVDNLTNELIQHLKEAIKFSVSEIKKINCIKQQVEKLLNDSGNINLLDLKGHLNLYELDIQKYRLDEMIQLMERLGQVKKQINKILSQKNEGIIQNI